MIYTFKSRAAADLKMTQTVADRVLSLIGKAPSAQGILSPEDMPAALRALEAAVAAEIPRRAVEDDGGDDGPSGTPRAEDPVSLRQRVWPMVEMMKASMAEKQPIVWEA